MLQGAATTLELTAASIVMGTIIGVILGWASGSARPHAAAGVNHGHL